jgi:hypothetical protein
MQATGLCKGYRCLVYERYTQTRNGNLSSLTTSSAVSTPETGGVGVGGHRTSRPSRSSRVEVGESGREEVAYARKIF